MVELADGTRKLLSELAGAEAAARFRFRPDLQGPTDPRAAGQSRRPVDDKRQHRAGLSGGEAVVHIQRSGYDLPANDRSGGASKGLL